MTNDYTVTNTEKLEQQNPGMKTKIKLKKLKDQVIVITGATSGTGLVTARMPNLRFTAGRKASGWSLKKNRHPSRLRSSILAELTRPTTSMLTATSTNSRLMPLDDLPAGSGRRSHPVCS